MADNSLNANHFAQRITATPAFDMNALRPIMNFQVSMLRMWADSIERLAGNYKKGFEETKLRVNVAGRILFNSERKQQNEQANSHARSRCRDHRFSCGRFGPAFVGCAGIIQHDRTQAINYL
jgi:hypothetical protein